jgi:diguanylate cyclase (GGDEF)-like protein/PAS domain S-box-containing protein
MAEANFGIALAAQPQVLSVSKGVETLLGYTPHDFLSSKVSLADLIHPHDADIAERLFSVETPKESGTLNIRLRHADGRIRCVRCRYKKSATLGGKVVLDVKLQDAKSLWKAPGRQRLSPYLEAMLENTDDFIFFKDRNHVFTAASRNMTAGLNPHLFGPSLLGLTDYDLFPEKYADIYYRLEKQVFAGLPVASEIHETQTIDGKMVWLDNHKYPIHDRSGRIIGLFGVSRDITEHIKAAQALRESEEFLRQSQESAGIGSYVGFLDKGEWKCSNVLESLLGIAKKDLHILAEWTAVVHPDDRAMTESYFADEVLAKSQPFDKEYRIIRPTDHAVRWVQGLGSLERDSSGQPIVMRGTIQDITERKLAALALRQGNELLELLIENAPVSLSMFDREMRYLAVNRRARKEFGLGDRELIGLSHYEVLPWFPESLKDMHRRALAGETVESAEDRFERPDGTVGWGRSEALPWRSSDGAIGGIILFTEDITEQRKAEAALRVSREILKLFIEHAPAALAMVDREMRYLAVSRRWLEDYGFTAPEILGHSHYELLPEISERVRELHRRAMKGEIIQSDVDQLQRANGKIHWLRRDVRPWRTDDGQIGGIILFTEDITERKRDAERLNLIASVFTHASEGIVITDAGGSILEVNDSFTRISGYTRDEVLGKNPRIFKSGHQGAEFYEAMWRALVREGLWSGEVWNRAKNGEEYVERLTISALRDASGKTEKYVAMFTDITSAKEHESKLQHIALYDTLTGLPNRANLATRLHQAMADANHGKRPVAVALIDLDDFEAVNDRYGHSLGNDLLIAIARRMKAALLEGDTLARLGGDEFVVVLPNIADIESSWQILHRVQKAASDPVQFGDLSLQVSISTGVTFFPQTEAVGADQLLRQADQAMCQAKREGKGRSHVFDPAIDRSARDLHENTDRIHQGLIDNEFVLYYQPKVNMRTGQVLGVEALIRWQHPERGLIPPGAFLPVIEGHPLAIEVGKWVIDNALTQWERWRADGLDLSISVNLAAEQLQQPGFASYLGAALAAHPTVPPSRFELEVLESSEFKDAVRVSEVIRDCKKLGVTFSLDDFGTGYASLTYLRKLPVDVLKIDQTFVRDMLDDAEDLTVLEGIIALARTFRCQVVAEGVETAEHGLMLLRLGCQIAQGFGIARPMPARDLPAWVSAWCPGPLWENVLPFDPGDRPVLYAGVEHRAWIVAIEDFLDGKRQSEPALDIHHCKFGIWLRGEALVDGEVVPGRGGLLGFRSIDLLHRRIHALADRILTLNGDGRKSEAICQLAELHALRNNFTEKLANLVQP